MEFKLVDGYNGRYAVTPDGKVYSMIRQKLGLSDVPVKELVQQNNKGYLRVALRKEKWDGPLASQYVHRLVAIAYIPNPNNYDEVNHINGDKTDNMVENLEWCDHQSNIDHAWTTGLSTMDMFGDTTRVTFVGKHITTGEVVELFGVNALKKAGFTTSGVYRNINGTRGPHKKFVWSTKL